MSLSDKKYHLWRLSASTHNMQIYDHLTYANKNSTVNTLAGSNI